MLTLQHIHRPALERYALSTFKTLRDVNISFENNNYHVRLGAIDLPLNTRTNAEIFDHKVEIDGYDQPWFNRAGGGKDSRVYAESRGHLCLISAEVQTLTGSFRKFTSFNDNQSFLSYKGNEKHLFEVIRPDTTVMLFADHDKKGGLDAIRSHNAGVADTNMLFDLLELPHQTPVVLTSHRTKTTGDYLSTHLRFPTVSLETCNGTLKAIHHLLKHTGRDFGGLDYGTHSAYQQLRIPGCSKAGSSARLLPADGSPLLDISSLLVSNSVIRAVHITTEMVLVALKKKFGCSNNCGLKHEKVTLPTPEIEQITRQIHSLYVNKTARDPSSIRYQHGSLWSLDHAETCIHSEAHKSNSMYITVNNRAVYCQCLGRCRDTRQPVLLGYLYAKLSIEAHPWEKTPWNCYIGTLTVDVIKTLQSGYDVNGLARLLACIGDFKLLLDAYAGYDTIREWTAAITHLTALEKIYTPNEALTELTKHLEAKSGKKRKRVERSEFDYTFDFERFQKGVSSTSN